MELQVGDRFSDETGEWEVVGPPYSAAAEGSSARVSRGSTKTASAEVRSWDAFNRVNVKRATAEEGNR